MDAQLRRGLSFDFVHGNLIVFDYLLRFWDTLHRYFTLEQASLDVMILRLSYIEKPI